MRPLDGTVTPRPSEAPSAVCRRFLTHGEHAGKRTLDVGCGQGDLLLELAALGADVVGTEIDLALIASCRARGLDVREGKAEHLPFGDAELDSIVCSVVIPYTDERRAIAEWARTLKSGGRVAATYHGSGYGLSYLLRGSGARRQVYGLRMLVNTVYYRVSGRRLPGFLGDTICQSSARLRRYYDEVGFVLQEELVAASFLGRPQFLCHRLVKR